MTQLHAAHYREALLALLTMTTWAGPCWVDVERYKEGEPVKHTWSPIRCGRDRARLATTVELLDMNWSPEMALTLPRPKPFWGTAVPSTVLWCRIEGNDQLERARRFKPRPTLVLQEGGSSRRLLMWALLERVSWERCVELNKRLAYALHAVQKWADPDGLLITPPGTCLRHDRSKPVPIRVGRLTAAFYAADQVAGRLKDPPPADAWLAGKTAKSGGFR